MTIRDIAEATGKIIGRRPARRKANIARIAAPAVPALVAGAIGARRWMRPRSFLSRVTGVGK